MKVDPTPRVNHEGTPMPPASTETDEECIALLYWAFQGSRRLPAIERLYQIFRKQGDAPNEAFGRVFMQGTKD